MPDFYEHEDGAYAGSPEEAANLIKADHLKCANPRCQFHINPETVHSYYEAQPGINDRQDGIDNETYKCPACGERQYLLASAPFADSAREAYTKGPKNRSQLTTSGLTSRQLGQIAENILQANGEIPGYGPITWWSNDYKSPLDGGTTDWGIEVKGIDFHSKTHRFIPGKPKSKYAKNEMAEQRGYKGILGVLIVLDFVRSVADVYGQAYPVQRRANTVSRVPGGGFGQHDSVSWQQAYTNDWQSGIQAYWKQGASSMRLIEEVPFKNPFNDPNDPNTPLTQYTGTGDDFPEWLKTGAVFDPNSLTQFDLQRYRTAAERAWGDDTRHETHRGHPLKSAGQCYVTSRWLQKQLGGYVGSKDGHFFWLSPDLGHAIDLTGDQFHYKPEDASLQGIKLDEHHDGLQFEPHQLTHRPGPIIYKPTDHPIFSGFEVVDEHPEDERSQRFENRANAVLNGQRTALDYAGDAFPASEPQAVEDRYWHDEPNANENGEYNFFYGNGDLHVSPTHEWDELKGHAKVPDDHTGPISLGKVVVNAGKATFEVSGNIAAHSLQRVFKDYCKQVGWKWGGMVDLTGEPIGTGSEFGPVKSYVFSYNDHLQIASSLDKLPGISGTIQQTGEKIQVHGLTRKNFPAFQEWAGDGGLTLVGGNDNVLKTIEDLETDNVYSPEWNDAEAHGMFQNEPDERQPGGVFKCPACSQIFPSWNLYTRHRQREEPRGDMPDQDGKFPELPNMDAPHPNNFSEQPMFYEAVVRPVPVQQARRVQGFSRHAKIFGYNNDVHLHYVAYSNGDPLGYATVKSDGTVVMVRSAVQGRGIGKALMRKVQSHFPELKSMALTTEGAALMRSTGWAKIDGEMWKWAAGQEPKDLIPGPIPFIYDIQEDTITTGQPGMRQSDIPGKFTPGGIVEGTYEPGGKVFIRSMTNMPYTVRHMLELWYYNENTAPLKVTQVKLRDDEGKETKLAGHDIGGYIKAMVAADPDTQRAARALKDAGGQVFVVGGAVRDALMNKEPKDLDLMVTGLPADDVDRVLRELPGRVDLTGKDFGVFRYNGDVEIALPRKERSTGGGTRDFDVQADHKLTPEEDLLRRDFTVNAMAVDLDTGQLIDPYGGLKDVRERRLRTLHTQSLADDPLRTVRALVARSKHGFEPDDDTRDQMERNAGSLHNLPSERVQAELDKLMAGNDPAGAIRLAHETGVLKHIFPEVDSAFGYDQNNPHHELELGDHLTNVLDRVSQVSKDPDLRLAGLLHDIGKPASAWVDPETGGNHYYRGPNGEGANHEDVGAQMTEKRLRELKYPRERINRVRDLVQHHMFPAFTASKGARRFLNMVGDHADDLMRLRWADQGGKSVYPSKPEVTLDKQMDLINQVRAAGEPTDRSALAVNGSDLINWGYRPGPELGQILNHLTEKVLEDPSLNTPEALKQLTDEYTT